MRSVSSGQMRELDRRTMGECGVPGEALMDRAGLGVARAMVRRAGWSGLSLSPFLLGSGAPVRLLAGRGNNGGDVFAAARHLAEWGVPVEVWLAGRLESVAGDARIHLDRMRAAGVPCLERAEPADWAGEGEGGRSRDSGPGGRPAILVDGLLGTGVAGPAHGVIEAAIRWINRQAARNPVVSIDVPSGLNADTGEAAGETVRADVTVTLGLPKHGLLAPAAVEYVGNLEVVDIGIPAALVAGLPPGEGVGVELIEESEVQALLRRRPRAAHKGDFGRVLIVAGSAGYAGAAGLAARGALRAGAGTVTVLTPAVVAAVVAAMAPEAMVHSGVAVRGGVLASDSLRQWGRNLGEFDAALVGPGLTACDETRDLVLDALKSCRCPVVLDADALNVCSGRIHMVRSSGARVVLTPHPGELARLLGVTTAEIQADRRVQARRAAEQGGATVVLKGAGTLVAEPAGVMGVNLTGNPGMAAGGMGDVLGGILVACLAQGLSPADAARVAVFAHGRAGDRVALRASQTGLTAGDLIDELPRTWRELTGR